MVTRVTITMDPPPLFWMKVSFRGSEADRDIKNRAQRVEKLAKVLCPKRTGTLASTIQMDQSRTELGTYSFGYTVRAGGPRAPYMEYVHDGVAAHVLPKRPGNPYSPGRPVIWYRSPGGARLGLYSQGPISHPGQRAQPFLTSAIVAAAGS